MLDCWRGSLRLHTQSAIVFYYVQLSFSYLLQNRYGLPAALQSVSDVNTFLKSK
jgi:hypothetical protein